MKAKRTLALLLCMVMLVAGSVLGTVAYLTDDDAAVNTFTVGSIDIELAETTGAEYKMVPGNVIAKDPKVTVKAGSEACYVFVKIEESTNPKFDDYMTYGIADGWTALEGVDGVYYRNQADLTANGAEDAVYSVLAGDKVTVKTSVTKKMMDELQEAYNGAEEGKKNDTLPQLTFTACAVQMANLTLEEAWEEADKLLNPPATP